MPNYIKNRLEFKGDQNRINELIQKFTTQHERTPNKSFSGDLVHRSIDGHHVGWLNEKTNVFTRRNEEPVTGVPDGFVQDFTDAWDRFPDFEKIIPMPKELNISSDSWTMPIENKFRQNTRVIDHLDEIKAYMTERQDSDALETFIRGVRNYVNHGHATWYGWSIANWETKWNSSECEMESENVFTFTTAWSGVPKLITEIADQFEDVEIIYEYSDEDTGSNCGVFNFHNGILKGGKLENQSKEAYELAFKLRPDRLENYELIDGNYRYKDND